MTQFTATADSGPPPTPAPAPGTYVTSAPPGPQRGQPFGDLGQEKNDFERMGEDVYAPSKRLARQRLSGPATAIMVTIGIAMALNVILMCLTGGLMAGGGAGGGRGPRDEDVIAGGIGIVLRLVILAYQGVVFYGAQQMKDGRSYGWSLTTCIMSLLPCTGCCILTLPFGIWGLVVLNEPGVQQALRR
jgi:hypothetical protein